MVPIHPLIIDVYQAGLAWDDRMRPTLYAPEIPHFEHGSQAFINSRKCITRHLSRRTGRGCGTGVSACSGCSVRTWE
jgi:hypothetical protein